jgi:hypothetical protein
MAAREDALEQLRARHAELAVADAERKQLMRKRDDALRAARDAGATYKDMQAATGLANAAITTALGRQ